MRRMLGMVGATAMILGGAWLALVLTWVHHFDRVDFHE